MNYPILWYSNAPWCGTGYGQQTALFTPKLKERNFDVAIAANFGLQGAPIHWGEIPVLPGGQTEFSADILAGHYAFHVGKHKGLLFGLFDAWVQPPDVWGSIPSAIWIPIDGDRLGARDREFFAACRTKPRAVAMSRHGYRCLQDAGIDPLYVPHGVDTDVFTPEGPDLKADLSLPDDAFVIGINAANKGVPSRKAFAQQFDAFGKFERKHPEAHLLVHTAAAGVNRENLPALLDACGVNQAKVRWVHQYAYAAGALNPAYLAAWYRTCDVISNATMGEGFGLATIEAQACGRPVISTKAAASTELVPSTSGWLVGGVRQWNNVHESFWRVPDTRELVNAYTNAYATAGDKRISARAFAEHHYAADLVLEKHLIPVLNEIGRAL